MAQTTNALPERDLHVLFDLLVTLQGELLLGQLPPSVTGHVIRRLAGDGLVSGDTSVGELGAVIGDLVQRIRYALGEYPTLPEPSPRLTTYTIRVPTPAAAHACQAELTRWGGSAVTVRALDDSEAWEVEAAFRELPPDASYEARGDQISDLAGRHNGYLEGAGQRLTDRG